MRSRYFLGVLFLALAFAGPASARSTLDRILPGLRAEHPGHLSDAQPWTDSEGRAHYRIKWVTPEGRIIYFDADAESGRYRSSGGSGWRSEGRQDESGYGRDEGRSRFVGGGESGGGRYGGGDWGGGHGDWHGHGGGGGNWHGSGGGNWHGGGAGNGHGGGRGNHHG